MNIHFPVSISIGGHSILLHTLTEFLGMFIGFRYFLLLRKKQGDQISQMNRIYILIGAIFGSIIGSRLVGGFEDPEQLRMTENVWMHFYNNKSIAGGLLGGLLGVEGIKKIIGEKQRSGDLFVFPLLLAIIIGRIGCFSMGIYEDTYGKPTTFFMGMDLGDGLMRHPVILYEIIFLSLLSILLIQLKKKFTLASGDLFKCFLWSYFFFRFFIEFLKPSYTFYGALSTIQICSLIGMLYYLPDILKWLTHKSTATN